MTRQLRFFTLGVAALVLMLGLLAITPSASSAPSSLGKAAADEPCDQANNGGYRSLIQVKVGSGGISYAAPTDGILTSWSVAAPPTNPNESYASVTSMTVQFQVWRHVSGVIYHLVFISSTQSMNLDGAIHTFALSPAVPVQAGDQIGLGVATDGAMCAKFAPDVNDVVRYLNGKRYNVPTNPAQNPPVAGQDYDWSNTSANSGDPNPIGGNGDTSLFQHVNIAATFDLPPTPTPTPTLTPIATTRNNVAGIFGPLIGQPPPPGAATPTPTPQAAVAPITPPRTGDGNLPRR